MRLLVLARVGPAGARWLYHTHARGGKARGGSAILMLMVPRLAVALLHSLMLVAARYTFVTKPALIARRPV